MAAKEDYSPTKATIRCKGKIPPDGLISLPDAWANKIKPESLVVQITPYGVWQELYIESINYGGRQVQIKNNLGASIAGQYNAMANVKDGETISD
tara:strand:+ start:354 stop:638 length:285 start_codon:yes stop_codon:yes gene_type:complete